MYIIKDFYCEPKSFNRKALEKDSKRLGGYAIKNSFIMLCFAINTSFLFAQTPLTIEGTTINNTDVSWYGLNIKRNVPTTFIYRNNSITSVNNAGYLLQAGDESPLATNNNLDGQIITGNKFMWKGMNAPTIITHGLFVGFNINSIVKYNYLENVPYGIIFKSGTDAGKNMTFTSGGCAYNICKNGKFAGRVKGINGIKFFNNTFYNGDGSGWYFILITANRDRVIPSPSIGTKIFNNIFYSTTQIPMIKIESGCLKDFESDYNAFWCTAGEPTFMIDGVTKTWAQWQALGYDAHSKIVNPNFINTTDFVPTTRLDYGTNLGTDWKAGLSTEAKWVVGSSPAIINQDDKWQLGARLNIIIPTGVGLTGNNETIKMFPNPVSDELNIEFIGNNERINFNIINSNGQIVFKGTMTEKATVQTAKFSPGLYLLQIGDGRIFEFKKIIKV